MLVVVADGQQFGLALSEPFLGGGALTVGAMPVAATVVGDDRVGAIFAARNVATERHRAAALNRTHDLQLLKTDMGAGTTPRRPVVAKNIRPISLNSEKNIFSMQVSQQKHR